MKIAVVLILLVAAVPARAQMDWGQDHDPYISAIGVAGGLTSGTGLAVRWPALPQTMLGIAGGLWGRSDRLAWNVGTEIHYVLRQSGRLRFFAGPGVALVSNADEEDVNVNISGGSGVEYLLQERVAIKLDLGFTYQSDTEETYPLPQAAVFFYF